MNYSTLRAQTNLLWITGAGIKLPLSLWTQSDLFGQCAGVCRVQLFYLPKWAQQE